MTENQALPTVKIEIGGAEYSLLYSIYAFVKLQKVAGINALKGEVDFMDPSHLLYFLWAGIISHHEEFDGEMIDGRPDAKLAAALRTVGSMITISNMSRIGDSLRKAFQNATGSVSEEDKKGEGKKGGKKP
jgi:hypothetical protein